MTEWYQIPVLLSSVLIELTQCKLRMRLDILYVMHCLSSLYFSFLLAPLAFMMELIQYIVL